MERQNILPMLPVMIMAFGEMAGIALTAINVTLAFAVFFASMFMIIPYVFYASWYAEHQARRYHLIWLTLGTKRGKWFWRWRSRVQIWFYDHPHSDWIADGVCPDGTIGYWQTYLVPIKLNVRHPRYNHRGKITLWIMRHKEPYDRLFTFEDGQGVWNGFLVNIGDVCQAWGREIMPKVEVLKLMEKGTLRGIEVPNHVPFTDDNFNEFPVVWIREASGTFILEDAKESRKVVQRAPLATRPAMTSGPNGAKGLECLACGTPLPTATKDGKSRCTKCGKEWDMGARA